MADKPRADYWSLENLGVQLAGAGVWAVVTELPRALLLTPLENVRVVQTCSADLGIKAAGFWACASYIRENAGYSGFWRGVLASCAYDLTVRLAMPKLCIWTERALNHVLGPVDTTRKWDSPILRKILIGVTSQFGALFIAQPLHIAHVRMVVDLGATRKFTSLFNFYATVLKQESIAALFRGSTLLAIRSAVFSFFRFSLEYFIDRPTKPWSMFWYTMLMTNLPDIFKLPMDALRLRVIIGDPAVPANDYARYILANKCPIRLFDGFRSNFLLNVIYSLTAAAASSVNRRQAESGQEPELD